ncbi:hypothetical protein GBF38_016877 [Nibea albiflora]|uniref:Uncharacterized protein n=1 Tax=Nibea albiflora TaxID=240163 RepID=A0ACB7EF28_NIBAL|nr:hypothetical protein GBF38_016877 [Nibea albiflora]
MCGPYSAVSPQTDNNCRAAVTYKRKSPHGPVGRKRSQTTNPFSRDLGSAQTRRRGAGGWLCICRQEEVVDEEEEDGGGGGGGWCSYYYYPYFLRAPRAEPLQQPAEDHPIFQGGLQERFGIRDGLLRRLQHPERNQPCNRLFRRIHVQSQQIPLRQKQTPCLVSLTARCSGYAVIIIRALRRQHD